jgi:hypothetical protein
MTQVPEFEQRLPPAVPATLPIASLPPPLQGGARASGRGLGVKLLVGAAGVLGVAFFALLGQRLGLWPEQRDPEPPALSGPADDPALAAPPVVIAPDPPAPAASRGDRAEPERAGTPAKPAPAPSVPTPTPAPPSSSKAPTLPPGVPSVLPTPALPPGSKAPPPASLPTPPGMPQLPGTLPELPLPPFTLPSAAGACERCLATLRAGGNGSVLSASADDLLCNDRQGKESCETQLRELAPAVAEQAARANDCPAALATEAAGLRLGVDQERFRAVHTLCVR